MGEETGDRGFLGLFREGRLRKGEKPFNGVPCFQLGCFPPGSSPKEPRDSEGPRSQRLQVSLQELRKWTSLCSLCSLSGPCSDKDISAVPLGGFLPTRPLRPLAWRAACLGFVS